MRWFRTVVTLLIGFAAPAVLAYQPSATTPYTFTGCDICGTYSNDRVGDGNFHQPGCGQSGATLYWCDCSIGYAPSEMLQPPILTVDGNNVVLEYWARNIYCNPPPDGGNPQEPNAVSYRIEIVELDPVTLATVAVQHRIAPYWEHGKVTLTNLSPACKLYRAVYLVSTLSTTYAASSDVVGATGSATAGGASCLLDMGPCPGGAGGSSPSGGVSPSVGKPINVGSGNMYYSEPLFSIAGPGDSSLPFSLAYNSRETTAGALGPAFTHTFDQRLAAVGNHRLWRDPEGLRTLWVLENHPPTGEVRRAVYPGDATGTMTLGTNFQIRALDGSVTEFNSSTGRWVRSADRWGNAVTGAYTGSDLTTITDALGRTLTLGYTGGKLTTVTDGDGNQWQFRYDAGGRLEKAFDPLHTDTNAAPWRQYSWVQYTTGSLYVLAKVSDDSGAVLEAQQYDAQGRVISSWSGDTIGDPPAPGPNARDLVTLSYDSTTQTTATSTVDTGLTQASVYTLKVGSGRFLATSIVGTCVSCGQVEDAVQSTFDDANHPLTRIVGTGGDQVESRYVYDANGMVTSVTEAFGKPEQRVTSYAYGMTNVPTWLSFITSITEASVAKPGQSKVTSRSWNAGETLLTESISGYLLLTDASPTVYTTTTTFDAKHRRTQRDGPVAGQRTAWSYYLDADANLNRRGRLQQLTVTTTATTSLATTYDDYNVYGTPRSETDPNSVLTQRTLDARGRTLTVRSVKPSGDANEPPDYVTTSAFDSRDRLTTLTRPLGNKSAYRHEDGTDRLPQTIVVDASGNERERVVRALNVVGGTTSESYEECTTPAPSCGTWVARKSDSFAYSAAARLSTITHPDATTAVHVYDPRGNLISIKDERHAAANIIHGYDSLNRLTTLTQKRTIVPGSDVVTSYLYDTQGNLTTVTDPNGNITTYTYDDFGRMQKQISPVSGTTTYSSYDASGNLLVSVDANGATTTRTYDLANRVLTSSSVRAGLPTESVVWTYDSLAAGAYGQGRVASMTDPTGATTYQYERRGLLRNEARTIGGVGSASSYGYDANGNRSSIGYPSGNSVTYAFDFADRPFSAVGSATFVSSATYYPFGPTKSLTFGNGTEQAFTFDDRYSPVTNTLTLAAVALASYTCADDEAGNITAIHDDLGSAWNRDFAYDDLNRLVTANSGASLWGAGSYSYDAMGNMLTQVLGSSSTTFSYVGTLPKLASVTSSATTSVTYDSAGNEIGAEVTRLISARNFVRQTEGPFVRNILAYDGRGVRVLRSEASKRLGDQAKITRSVYSPELRLLFAARSTAFFGTPTAARTTDIVWFGDRSVAQIDASPGTPTIVRYTFADHLGTPLLQTNNVGAVIWRSEYEPYGRIFTMRLSTADSQPLRFPGQEAPIAGDSYNIFRWYRSGWGKYTQADPKGLEEGPNLYQYVHGQPTRLVDPFGLAACPACSECQSGLWKIESDDLFAGPGVGFGGVLGLGKQTTFATFTCMGGGVRGERPQVPVVIECTLIGPMLGGGIGLIGPLGKLPSACGCNSSDLMGKSWGWSASAGPFNMDGSWNCGTDSNKQTYSGGFGKSWGGGFALTRCTTRRR